MLSRNKWILAFILITIIIFINFYGIGEKKKAENTNTSEMDFEAFYDKFHEDSEFQLSRIDFPLQGMPGMADSLTASKPFFWQKENWKILHSIDWDTVTGYTRRFEDTGLDIINEFICTPDMFCMKRRFAKKDDGWYLIFYSDMNYTKFE